MKLNSNSNVNIKVATIFFCLIMGIIAFFSLSAGTSALKVENSKSLSEVKYMGEYCSNSITYAKEVYTLKHFFTFIPTVTEHFYLVDTANGCSPVLVRANKSWYNKHFDASGNSIGNVYIKAMVKECNGDLPSQFQKVRQNVADVLPNTQINTTIYADTLYDEIAKCQILLGVSNIILIILFVFAYFIKGYANYQEMDSPVWKFAVTALSILSLVLFFYIVFISRHSHLI